MKGLVLEVREKTVILMSPRGEYLERPLPRGTVRVGQTLQLEEAPARRAQRVKIAAAFASVMLACLISVGSYGYTQPFGVVNVDINPSFQVTYNAFEQVLGVESLNPDGAAVLQNHPDFAHQPVTAVIQKLVEGAMNQGFIAEGKANVIYCAVSDRFLPVREAHLLNALWKQPLNADVEISRVLLKGSPEVYQTYANSGISPIPDLMRIVRESTEQEGLFKSDISIADIGKPVEVTPVPEIQTTAEPMEPLTSVVNTPAQHVEKPEPEKTRTESPQGNSVDAAKPSQTVTEAPETTQPTGSTSQAGNGEDTTLPVTSGTGGGQSDPNPSDNVSETTTGSPEPATSKQGSPDTTGPDNGSGGTESPGKGGSQ